MSRFARANAIGMVIQGEDVSEISLIEESRLAEGPLVVTRQMPDVQSVAIGLFVDVGSRDESDATAGIAHALEHMLFKGTTSLDVHALSERLDQLGGHANAFTSRERTCFHIHVLHEDWPEALALLTSMLLEPALPEEEWQREREVIFSEMAMVEDSPDEWVFDRHMEALFPGQMLGRPTLGTVEALRAISHHDLRDYLNCNYCPPRLLVAVAGRVEHAEVVETLSRIRWPRAGESGVRPQAQRAAGVQYLPRQLEQAQLVLTYPGTTSAGADRAVSWLANQMLGGSMSSLLFREVREKRGLAYSIGSHLGTMTDAGIWSISCGTDPEKLTTCIDVVRSTLEGFVQEISPEMLARARRQLEVQFRMGMDSVEGQMLYLGARLDEETLLSSGEWIEKIRRVAPEDVWEWVRQRLAAEPLWSVCAPEDVLKSAQKLLQVR